MKQSIQLAIISLCCLFPTLVHAQDATCKSSSSDVIAANASYNEALRASDTVVLARILSPDFLFITSGGEIRDRKELLRSYGAKEVRIKSFDTSDLRVRLHGTIGILTAIVKKDGDYMAGPRAGQVFTGQYRFTRVYACSRGAWQVVSTHESRLSP